MTNSRFELMTAFTFNGQKLETRVDNVNIAFLSTSKDWKFLNDQDVYALVDGKRFSLGRAARDSDVKLGSMKEFLAVNLPYTTLLKIANGRM